MSREAGLLSDFIRRATRLACFTALTAFAFPAASARAQSAPGGLWLEAEAQAVIGASDFEAGVVPSFFSSALPHFKPDEGNGFGGAATLGYGFGNGWSGLLRYRRLDADDSTGPIDPFVFTFTAGAAFPPGGAPTPLSYVTSHVDSKTSIVDLLAGRDLAVGGGIVQVVAGVSYVDIDRETVLNDGCSCAPYGVVLGNDFRGVGPKIGFRGGIPLTGSVRLVGGFSASALFGTATFASHVFDAGLIEDAYKHEDHRVVAALDGEAGVAFGFGAGTLTVGYRVDALLGALDTDQRVSPIFASSGLPAIGDKRDDFIEHGPFARFALPLGGGTD
jgi:hypothetical protein